jgi:hypothetical protein
VIGLWFAIALNWIVRSLRVALFLFILASAAIGMGVIFAALSAWLGLGF